jgi:hypothetical protein
MGVMCRMEGILVDELNDNDCSIVLVCGSKPVGRRIETGKVVDHVRVAVIHCLDNTISVDHGNKCALTCIPHPCQLDTLQPRRV